MSRVQFIVCVCVCVLTTDQVCEGLVYKLFRIHPCLMDIFDLAGIANREHRIE